MAKQSGLGDQLYIGGYNLSNDVGAVDSVSSPYDTQDVTGIDKSARERIGLVRDAALDFSCYWNPATNRAHDILSNMPTADVVANYFRGSGIGNVAAGMVAKQIDYKLSRNDDGSISGSVNMVSNGYGLNWGEQLTPGIATIGAAGAQASLDYGASVGTTNFGLVAYLQVFALTGTSATVAIQSSTDNGAGDAFADVTGAVFTAATGITAERIATGPTAAVERYLRVNVTGTFTLLWFSVMVARHPMATSY
jgi:hypothetical protein